jgi:hypothetical protein
LAFSDTARYVDYCAALEENRAQFQTAMEKMASLQTFSGFTSTVSIHGRLPRHEDILTFQLSDHMMSMNIPNFQEPWYSVCADNPEAIETSRQGRSF